ncbi:delta-lactam-biosynthetic de-N-acetylase [Halobacillus faecis]|uniref:Delta-lactam-biosynthetic de-N-acetylase n=1 Tax=Halobacillus faecis TaxID=360184 RepID=A0A511WQU8_9BACI|nr:delta-lactam-biosynthetic de-N-acetylase [Halobacillus faecis]GEN53524.1 delta-lactam-biosynthetic de-N-acetylase [Halobacillus faecis]
MWKRTFAVLLALFLLILPNQTLAEGWGFSKKKDGSVPDVGRYGPMIDKYDGFYVDTSGDPVVYLTFDNGYEQGYTGQVLDVLKEKDVPATFFVTGHYIESAPELLKRMAKEGHLIGNHSWSHPDFTKVSKEKMKRELERVDQAVKDLTDQEVMTFVRPPRGTFNEKTLEWAKEFGYTHAFWSLAFVDWETDKQRGWEYAYRSVIDQIHPGAVILLHTVSQDNAEALSQLIDELRKRGYRFGSLNDLMIKQMVPAPVWGL